MVKGRKMREALESKNNPKIYKSQTDLNRGVGNHIFMNTPEILGYVLLSAAAYPPVTIVVNTISMILSRQINSQSSLDSEIEKEKKRLGLQDVGIEGKLVQGIRGRFYPVADHSYVIEMGGFCANTSTVRHEINHIRRMEEGKSKLVTFDVKSSPKMFDIFKYAYSSEELSSILYEAFRIKI